MISRKRGILFKFFNCIQINKKKYSAGRAQHVLILGTSIYQVETSHYTLTYTYRADELSVYRTIFYAKYQHHTVTEPLSDLSKYSLQCAYIYLNISLRSHHITCIGATYAQLYHITFVVVEYFVYICGLVGFWSHIRIKT